ncbi:MAG: Crp/Fnr family transcriptional regulator [Desulfobacter sp.]
MTDPSKISLAAALKRDLFRDTRHRAGDLAGLSDLFITRRYSSKSMLVNAGEKWETVYFIHKGLIRLFYTDKEGREFNKGFFRENHFLWPVAPSARKDDSLFSIVALEDIKVSVCRFDLFYSWLSQHGHWERFALPYAESFATEKFMREYEFLIHSATERYQNFCARDPDLAGRIPDYHLASYLGITNVSLSRIKKSIRFNIC